MEVYNVAITGKQTKEGFLRDSLVELYSACDAPETIDSVELQEVNESDYQFLACNAEFEGEFTAEIGYDRKEQYLDEVREYNADLKKYVSRTVVKERVVTDWRPHSGRIHKERASLKELGNNDTTDYGDLDPELMEKYGNYGYSKEEVVVNGQVNVEEETLAKHIFTEPTKGDMSDVLAQAEIYAEAEVRSELPGDHYRNFRPEIKPTKYDFTVYSAKRFKTAFDFRGKTHFLKQFTTEQHPTIYCSAMNSDDEAYMLHMAEKKELDTDPIIQKSKQIVMYGQYAFFGCIALAILFGCILPMIADFSGVVPFILCVLGAIISYVGVCKSFQKRIDKQTKIIQDRFQYEKDSHFRKLQEKKIGLLNARLVMMGQQPLSEAELLRFNENNKHQLDANYKV